MYDYQSDATKFIDAYLEKNPKEAEERMKNRNMLWDIELSPEEQANFEAAALAKKPCAYQPD